MKATKSWKTVDELLQLKLNNMLYANPEYQRGAVWKSVHKKRLVDSVFRGYPLPLIYLHHISKEVAGARRDDFEVIDGQQRINALYEYKEGNFKLFDPIADADEAQFPSFITEQECAWGGKRFDELTPELQTQMLGAELSVMMIETHLPNEARDLFIRLQAGMPLNSQEKRDAWPGSFTDFVLKVAGKPEIPKYPGNDFFKVVMRAKVGNRGEFRQLAAQIAMLYFHRQETGRLCEISGEAIDSFYHKHLDFDASSADVKRFTEILDRLKQLLGDGKRKKVLRHEAISLVLLVDSLLDDYTQSWTTKFGEAFDSFRQSVAQASKTKYDEKPDEYWLRYGLLTRSNTDRVDTIERRHLFFVDKMQAYLKPQLKDSSRIFGALERELIYYRDKKRCQRPGCGAEVTWSDAEYHHVELHSQGGRTTLQNGALVHKACHPKSAKDVAAFADGWEARVDTSSSDPAPNSVSSAATKPQEKNELQPKRGRPKLPPEEKLVARLVKLGIPPEKARESAIDLLEKFGDAKKL
jgi:hypothetical protein